MPTIDAVLSFWFGELTDGFADDEHRGRWFDSSPDFDAAIRTEFGDLIQQATTGQLDAWLGAPEGCLAYIVVTDQFPRNVFRGQREAFATDPLALDAARDGIRLGYDRELAWDERAFFYLPFEHSEDLIDQHTSVGLFTQLRDETPAGRRHLTGNTLRYAHQHRDIVARFGRFPHRNPVLGRESSAEELAFAEGGAFGQ